MGKPEDIINKIRSTIARYDMIARGERIVVALSGGPDSVCLLDVLHRLSDELEINLIAAHFDHGLRGDEDGFETQLSEDIALSMSIPFEAEKASDHLKSSSSLEERAREARYAFLEKVRIEYGAQKIAMGHNLNDQAETVIMRLLRGSGPSGLGGIPPVRGGRIIRPLIEITRDEITDYLKLRGLPFAVDSSNNSKRHLRNRIRLELVPMLIEYQPNLLAQLGRFSNIIRDEDAFLDSMALEWIESELRKTDEQLNIKPGKINENLSVAVSSIKNLPAPLKNRVIRILLKKVNGSIYPLEYDHIVSVAKLLDNEKPQCSVDLPGSIIVKKSYQALYFKLKGEKQSQRRKKTPPHPRPLPQGEREFMGPPSRGERRVVGSLSRGEREVVGQPSRGEREFMGSPSRGEREVVGQPSRGEREFMGPPSRGEREVVGSPSRGEREVAGSPSRGEREVAGSPSRGERSGMGFSCSIDGPGIYHLDAFGQTLMLEEINMSTGLSVEGDLSTAYLDSDKLQYPLTARSFTPGDRFLPLGMKGHKKVKNFFIDLKVPNERRALTPILTCGDKIVWVCGYRIDERFKVTEETKRVLKVAIIPAEG